MKCTQCGSMNVVKAGAAIGTGGATFYPRRCEKCGYFWSDRKPPVEVRVVGPAPVVIVKGVPPVAPAPVAPPAPESEPINALPLVSEPEPAPDFDAPDAGEEVEKVPAEEIAVGDVIKIVYNRKTRVGPVAGISKKTFVMDVDGVPDVRVRKSALLGRIKKA